MRMTRMRCVVLAMTVQACSSTIEGSSSGTGRPDGGDDDGGAWNQIPPGATRPPPVIDSISPLEGDYGTVVTIKGDNLDEGSAKLILAGPVEPREISKPSGSGALDPKQAIVSWSKTEIKFKYPFPAEGAITVSTKSGQAGGTSFAPSYRPGSPTSGVFTRRELMSVVAPKPGVVVAAFDGESGPQIMNADSNGVSTKAFNRGSIPLTSLSLYATASGSVEGIYESGGIVFQLTNLEASPTVTSTGVTALDAAGGNDESGPYAWIRKSGGQLARIRPPTWAESEAPVNDPTPAGAPGPAMAVSPDNALFVGWGINDTGSFPLYDHEAYPTVRRLRSGQTTFDGAKTFGDGADDVMIWTRFLPGPDNRVYSYYCANDTGFLDPEFDLDCGEAYSSAGVPVPPKTTASEYVAGFNATTTMVAWCDPQTDTLKVGPEGQTAQQKAIIYPCPRVVSVSVDPNDAPLLLVQAGNYVYSPRAR